jgi:AcrR family transcriptional regulator
MPYDSAATKARILSAATTEFSTYGLAGARVDRIAAGAEANKQLIYAYFGNKEALFDAALDAHIDELLDAVPFDATDLPAYAQRLIAFEDDHPELGRLARWHLLERPGVLWQLPQSTASMGRKVAALAQAQADGIVDDTLPPDRLLSMLLALIHGGSLFAEPEAVRDSLATAVARLVLPR